MKPGSLSPRWLLAAGASGLGLAARLHEIHRHTGDVAINDQWKIEAADLVAPWLDGALHPAAFLSPHFEHLPVWTRLLAWLEVAVTGRWDPFVQTTVNAVLFAAFLALVVRWIARHLAPVPAVAASLLLVAGTALPHAWENITWGFQSQFPLALLALFLHAHGSFAGPEGGRRWWWAQAAGLAGLFTLAGMWLAPLAVLLAAGWTRPRFTARRLVPLALALTGLALIFVIRANSPPFGTFAQTARTPWHFLNAWLDLLGWPAGWPGAFLLVNLPFVLFALRLRGRADSDGFDRTVLALGLWGAAQAAALAYARGADYGGYVSRYGDLHLVLVLANGLALLRLLPAAGRARAGGVACAAAWTALVVTGWWQLAHGGHTAYFHDNSAARNLLRREAVQAYLQRHDRRLLEKQETRWVLYQDVNQVTSLLDHPRFRAVLPASVNPANPPDPAGSAVRFVQAHALAVGALAGLLLVGGAAALLRTPGAAVPALPAAEAGLAPWVPLALALAAGLMLCHWADPFTFPAAARWRHLLEPAGSVTPLQVRITGGSHDYPPERLVGAAPLAPPELRALVTGTEPEGPGLTCTAVSRPFPVASPWFIVPFAGWTVAHGNGLRLRIEEPDGRVITEVACDRNSPGLAFWAADVRAFAGKTARLVLYDGRTETEAWVAAAAPIATEDPALAARLARRAEEEALAGLHTALGVSVLFFTLAGAGLAWVGRGAKIA